MSGRKLILHCGPPKTGTSAIQAYLRNASLPGLYYPKTGQWPDGAHHKLLKAFQGVKRRGDIEIPPFDDLVASLADELADRSETILLSTELLPLRRVTEFVAELTQRIPGGFDEVETVIVLRHPLLRAASTYNQAIKDPHVGERRSPDDYLADKANGFLLSPLVKRWSALPMPNRCLSYHPSETLVPRFLNLLGYPDVDCTVERRNLSMNGFTVVTLLLANQMSFSAQERSAVWESLRQDRANKIWRGSTFPFSEAAVGRYMERVTPDLDRLIRIGGVDLTEVLQEPPQRFQLTDAQVETALNHLLAAAPDKVDMQKAQTFLGSFTGS